MLQINGALTNGRINKTGAGVLQIFNNGNTFTGQNVVNAGTLWGTAGSIGGNVLNNATVIVDGGTFSTPVISGTGQVVVRTNVVFNAAQTYTGGTDVLDAFSEATGTSSTLLGSFTSSGNGTLHFAQSTGGTFTGSMSGNLIVRKSGAGVLELGGVNTHTFVTDLSGGGLRLTTDTALGSATLQVNSSADPASIEAVGSRTFANPVQINYNLAVNGAGSFNFTNTTAKFLNNNLVHNSTGNTTLAGKFTVGASGAITVNNGQLTLGNAGAVGGFIATGPITVNGGTLSLNSLNFISLPDVTLAGGTLNTPKGYAIPLGAALQENGAVTGRVASANGSTIIANGSLALGDAAHPAGVNLDGELYTDSNTVTLNDSNQAVLGSLTDLGTPTQDGTLVSPNGAVLNFGRNIVGRGQVQSNNTLADAVIINGDVNGDSFANYVEFTGFVKGVGTYNNVAFSGTFSPGLSPTLSSVGSAILTASNILDMEVGGLNRGSQYDAFDISGMMQLNGTMKVSLINAFTPSLGDQFDLFDGTTIGGFTNFDFNLAPLSPGLAWDTSLLYSGGILQVVNAVPEPSSLAIAALTAMFAAARAGRSMRN